MYAIGIDLGGTKIEAGLVDAHGHVIKSSRVPTDVQGGPEAIQKQLVALIQELSIHPIQGIGIGAPGQVEAKTGKVYFAPNLQWRGVPLQDNLNFLNVPIVVLNDVRAATWGEWLFGAGKGSQDIVCAFFGTGIGGGIISGGHLLTGCTNTCGEIGHIVLDIHGPPCSCGNRGCLESIAGGWGIAKNAQTAVQKNPKKGAYLLELARGQLENISAKHVKKAAEAKDPLGLELLEQIIEAIIKGCVSFIHAYNPCRLILGGGFIDGSKELIPIIDEGVKKYAFPLATEKLQVIHAQLSKDAGVIGAAAYVLFKEKHD